MGNLDAFAMHKRNIASIVSLRGGLEGMQNGSIVKGIVMQYVNASTVSSQRLIVT